MTSKEALREIFNGMYNKQGFIKEFKVIEKLVERDTPKKPLLVEVSADNAHHYVCSYCNATINIGGSIAYNKVFNIFCKDCGQRLDWSKEWKI